MKLKSIALAITASLIVLATMGQNTERATIAQYDLRADSDSRTRTSVKSHYTVFQPQNMGTAEDKTLFEQSIEVQQSDLDRNTYLYIENTKSAYDLYVNNNKVASCEDSLSPTEYDITEYLTLGESTISLIMRPTLLPELEQGIATSERPTFEGSYIHSQERLKIYDYLARVEADKEPTHGRLYLDIIVENRFNYDETINVGYDIYDPAGKLLDFSTRKVTLKGNSRDTVSFSPYLYGAVKHLWSTNSKAKNQPLYNVTLYTKDNRVSGNYIPFRVAYSGAQSALKIKRFNALHSEAITEAELRKIKSSGYNTISPSSPQPLWLYELCDKVGLYIIEQVAINAPAKSDDRGVGGTPSNNPQLKDEYIERVKKSYFRTRNFNCVVAYSLGSESGNGYNMYKAYQWLKSRESRRPIIYEGAKGEWNSDELNIAK